MLDPTLHRRIALAIGWPEAEVKSFSLAALRDLLRGHARVNQVLAEELDDVIRSGAHLTRGPETAEEARNDAEAERTAAWLDERDAPRPQRWRVTYRYVTPGSAGPFLGKMIMERSRKPEKGETIYAIFGAAVVTTCRKAKENEHA